MCPAKTSHIETDMRYVYILFETADWCCGISRALLPRSCAVIAGDSVVCRLAVPSLIVSNDTKNIPMKGQRGVMPGEARHSFRLFLKP